jgi:cell division protein ZapA (FtsZ GTPase activity inhibitor)
MNSVKVKIGSKEYSLSGDRDLIVRSANEVNNQINLLQSSSPEAKGDIVPILAALNIAESKITEVEKLENEINQLKINLTEMTNKLNSIIN